MLARSTTFGLAIATALAAAATWFVFHNVPPEGGAPRERFLISSDAQNYTYIEIETSNSVMTCQNQQGSWWITRPITARADMEKIQRLLDSVAVAPVLDVITIEEQRIRNMSGKDFGLAAPQARIFLNGPNTTPAELRFGNASEVTGNLYVGMTGSPKIRVTEASLLRTLPDGIGDIRDRALLPYPTSQLTRFELRSPGNPLIAIEKNPEGVWWIRQPGSYLASAQAIAGLLSYVENTRIARFVHTFEKEETGGSASVEDLAIAYECTPEEAVLMARFWFPKSLSGFRFSELRVGKKVDAADEQVYLLSTEERLVVTVPESFPHSMKASLDDLRDRRLWPFAASSIKALSVKSESGSVSVARLPDGGWSITEPIRAPANNLFCDELARSITEAKDIRTSEYDTIDRYDLSFEITCDSPRTGVHTALVVRATADEGDEDAPEAWDWFLPGNSEKKRIPSGELPSGFGTPAFTAAMRDSNIMSISPGQLREISYLVDTGEVFQVSVSKDQSRGAPGENGNGYTDELLPLIENLNAERVVALAPPSLDDFGLRNPVFSIILRLRDTQTAPRVLAIGSYAPEGGRYVSLKGQDSVFLLSQADTAKLEAPLKKPLKDAAAK